MVWYFYQSQNKLQKRKERLNREKTEGKRKTESSPLTWATPAQLTVSAAQPAASPCRLPRRGEQLAGAHADAGEHLLACLASPEPSSHVLETPWSHPHPFPPSTDTLLVSLAVFVDVRELTGAHRRGNPWPPSSSAAATLSRTRAVVVFIAVCKQSTPGAPSTSSSSPSRRWTRKSSSSIPPQPQLLRLPRVRLCNHGEQARFSPHLAA